MHSILSNIFIILRLTSLALNYAKQLNPSDRGAVKHSANILVALKAHRAIKHRPPEWGFIGGFVRGFIRGFQRLGKSGWGMSSTRIDGADYKFDLCVPYCE